MPEHAAHDSVPVDLLRLTLTPGLGPVLIARLIVAFGSAEQATRAGALELAGVKGVSREKAAAAAAHLRSDAQVVKDELALVAKTGVRLVAMGTAEYPRGLMDLASPPPILYVKGRILPAADDKYPVAIVGSRQCSAYGIEQADRFGGALAAAGLTIVSGGARGIDTAAHRGALRAGGRTVAILGCGLGRVYPPENLGLFDEIARPRGGTGPGAESSGAVVSELPMLTNPDARNFPARNRLIAAMALGVVVIEAAHRSGALITARLAVEELGREAFAVPGRVDSEPSGGSLQLLKAGMAGVATEPADVINGLEWPARNEHLRGAPGGADLASLFNAINEAGGPGGVSREEDQGDDAGEGEPPTPGVEASPRTVGLSDSQLTLLALLDTPRTVDELVGLSGGEPGLVRADVTMLELRRCVARRGSKLEKIR